MKTGYQTDTCDPLFTAVSFTSKIRTQPTRLSTDEQIKTHTQWSIVSRERGKSWGHGAQWCGPHGGRQTLCDIT